MRELAEGVMYRQFAAMAKIAGWTVEELAAEFRGIAEREPAPSYFARVLRGDPDWSIVIPFRPATQRSVSRAKAERLFYCAEAGQISNLACPRHRA